MLNYIYEWWFLTLIKTCFCIYVFQIYIDTYNTWRFLSWYWIDSNPHDRSFWILFYRTSFDSTIISETWLRIHRHLELIWNFFWIQVHLWIEYSDFLDSCQIKIACRESEIDSLIATMHRNSLIRETMTRIKSWKWNGYISLCIFFRRVTSPIPIVDFWKTILTSCRR